MFLFIREAARDNIALITGLQLNTYFYTLVRCHVYLFPKRTPFVFIFLCSNPNQIRPSLHVDGSSMVTIRGCALDMLTVLVLEFNNDLNVGIVFVGWTLVA